MEYLAGTIRVSGIGQATWSLVTSHWSGNVVFKQTSNLSGHMVFSDLKQHGC